MKGPLFFAKILLFGEYGIIKDSILLTSGNIDPINILDKNTPSLESILLARFIDFRQSSPVLYESNSLFFFL